MSADKWLTQKTALINVNIEHTKTLYLAGILFGCGEIIGFYHTTPPRGGARGVIVIVVGNEHGDTSSNPGRD